MKNVIYVEFKFVYEFAQMIYVTFQDFACSNHHNNIYFLVFCIQHTKFFPIPTIL